MRLDPSHPLAQFGEGVYGVKILTIDLGSRTPRAVHTVLGSVASSYDIESDAARGLRVCRSTRPSVAVLCVDQSGPVEAAFARRLRGTEVTTPLLVLAGRAQAQHVIRALDNGADDYLLGERPAAELAARVRALARREPSLTSNPLEYADVRLDPLAHRAWLGGVELHLPHVPFTLLETLMRHPDRALSRSQLLALAWDPASDASSNVVDQAVAAVRRVIGHERISTVRGVGYRFESS